MREFQLRRVQKVPRQTQRRGRHVFETAGAQFPWCAIQRIAHDGMADRREVYPDLMGAPGIDLDLEQCELAVGGVNTPYDLVVRESLAASGVAGGHAGAPSAVAADAGRDRAGVFLNPAVDERDVLLLHFAPRELIG